MGDRRLPGVRTAPDRATWGAVLVVAALVALTALLAVRPNALLPRWDAMALLALAAAGLGIRAWALREAPPVDLVSPPAPRTPPGFRADRLRWWPERRAAAVPLVCCLLGTPLALLAFTGAANSGTMAGIRAEGARIALLPITAVEIVDRPGRGGATRSKRGQGTYHSVIEVNTRADRTGDTLRGPLETLGTSPGREVWVVYAPTAPELGMVADERRERLAELLADAPAPPLHLALAALPAAGGAGLWWWRRRRAAHDRVPQEPVAPPLHRGHARALRVRVAEPGSRSGRVPALRLVAPEGERELRLGPWADARRLTDQLAGREGWLYWARTPLDRVPKYLPAPDPTVSAVLVLADGRYLRGAVPAAPDGGLPQGLPVARIAKADCPEVLPLDRRTLSRPRLSVWRSLLLVATAAALVVPLVVPLGSLDRFYAYHFGLLFTVPPALGLLWYRAARAPRG